MTICWNVYRITVNLWKKGLSTPELDPDPMRIRDPDPDPQITLSPHDLRSGSELHVVLRDGASSSGMCVVCMPCGAHVRVTLNPHQGSGFSESGFSARVESIKRNKQCSSREYKWMVKGCQVVCILRVQRFFFS